MGLLERVGNEFFLKINENSLEGKPVGFSYIKYNL